MIYTIFKKAMQLFKKSAQDAESKTLSAVNLRGIGVN
jgi:hypothetical protein